MRTNFVNKLREKFPLLIESYVEDYGEKYIDRITDIINNTKFLFYIYPSGKLEDLLSVSDILDRLALFKFLRRLGFTKEELEINSEDCVVLFKNDEVNKFVSVLFDFVYLNSDDDYVNNYKGIYSFLTDDSNYDILCERMKVLNGLGITKVSEQDYLEFKHSDLYKHACDVYRKIARIALECAREANYKYNNFERVYNAIYVKLLKLKEYYMKQCLISLLSILPEADRKIIEENPDFKLEDISCAELIFDISEKDNPMCDFGEGLLESDSLLKEMCNDVYSKINDVLGEFEGKYIEEASKCIVIDGDIKGLWADDLEDMFDEICGGYCNVYYDGETYRNLICINLFSSYGGTEIDNTIDHEIRHAIERFVRVGEEIEEICGNRFSIIEEDYMYVYLENFNEAYTDFLSVNSCQRRWENGEYIFSPQVYTKEEFGSEDDLGSTYSQWFNNLKIIISGYEDIIKESRMKPDNDMLYELLPLEDWDRIDELLPHDTEEARNELRGFAKKMRMNVKHLN